VDVAAVWAEIQAMTWLELLSIAAVAVWNFATYWALWVAVTVPKASASVSRR
jgi:hypothetical protein